MLSYMKGEDVTKVADDFLARCTPKQREAHCAAAGLPARRALRMAADPAARASGAAVYALTVAA